MSDPPICPGCGHGRLEWVAWLERERRPGESLLDAACRQLVALAVDEAGAAGAARLLGLPTTDPSNRREQMKRLVRRYLPERLTGVRQRVVYMREAPGGQRTS